MPPGHAARPGLPPGLELIAAGKADFGTNRIQRWFDRLWDHGERPKMQPKGTF